MREWVHAESLDGERYRLLYSPGFVEGIAAGDEFRLLGNDGAFEITRRGGNLVVQVLARELVAPFQWELTAEVEALGGWRDGGVERGLVFTFPLAVGFLAIDELFERWSAEQSAIGFTWAYGNVYDPADGVTPLRWWEGAVRDGPA